ncbi:hypothetical protein SKAU_G00304840 [Synaphobranchus kaupii]|uniref:Uncharacterized protein n=1 Tax=Synaphobranchus kaupii TaxID=118154 RepID=A0A9Q1EWI0_SYNKA|nr:hypothetical protein SKAU_G00304840 [Synaphobranchus kaupii]
MAASSPSQTQSELQDRSASSPLTSQSEDESQLDRDVQQEPPTVHTQTRILVVMKALQLQLHLHIRVCQVGHSQRTLHPAVPAALADHGDVTALPHLDLMIFHSQEQQFPLNLALRYFQEPPKTSSNHLLPVSHLDDQFGRNPHQMTSPPNLLGKGNGRPRMSQTNIWCQTPLNRSLAPTSQGDSGQLSIDSGLVTAPAWPAFTGGAAAQAHCVLVERSKQWNTSLKPALSKD